MADIPADPVNSGTGMTWDLKRLRNDVERLYGSEQRQLISPCLNSIHDKRAFARYHYQEAKQLMATVLGSLLETEVTWHVLGGGNREAYETARSEAAAHIDACIHNMHSVVDILAHAIYYGLGMNLDEATAIKPKHLGIHSLRGKLSEGSIKELVTSLVEDDGFRYLSDLSNHSKHRSIVRSGYSVDFSGVEESPHGMQFTAFESDGRVHAPRTVNPTLVSEYQRQEDIIQRAGLALNTAVTMKAGS